MSLYMIATLLEHEMLIGLANEILHGHRHKVPTAQDLKEAHLFADSALKLAHEGTPDSKSELNILNCTTFELKLKGSFQCGTRSPSAQP